MVSSRLLRGAPFFRFLSFLSTCPVLVRMVRVFRGGKAVVGWRIVVKWLRPVVALVGAGGTQNLYRVQIALDDSFGELYD